MSSVVYQKLAKFSCSNWPDVEDKNNMASHWSARRSQLCGQDMGYVCHKTADSTKNRCVKRSREDGAEGK